MRPSVKRARPQRHEQPCVDCDAAGLTLSEEWEGDGMRRIAVTCEGCCGLGIVTECECCDEPLSLAMAEERNGVCGWCRADLERGDASAEIARIARGAA